MVARKANADKFARGTGVCVAGSNITFSVKLKSLGVTVERSLSLDHHVGNIVKSSNFNIQALRHIRPVIDRKVANAVACSIVSTRLDYHNSVLYGASAQNIQRLKRVQNSLAQVVSGTEKQEHIKPVLQDLHWLPVPQRIEYNVALITHKVLNNNNNNNYTFFSQRHHSSQAGLTDYRGPGKRSYTTSAKAETNTKVFNAHLKVSKDLDL